MSASGTDSARIPAETSLEAGPWITTRYWAAWASARSASRFSDSCTATPRFSGLRSCDCMKA